MKHFREEAEQSNLEIDTMKTDDMENVDMTTVNMETDSLEFIEHHMEILENDLAPDMRFQETEGIRSRFYEKSAAGSFKAESRRKNADIRKGNTGTGRKKRKKVYLVMAAVLVLLCGIGAAASYGNWRLPTPETFTGDITKVKETASYTWDEGKQAYVDANGNILQETGKTEDTEETGHTGETEETKVTEQTPAQAEPLTDTYCLEKTREIIKLIHKENMDTSQMKISYQKDEWWNREEVMVSFAKKDGEGGLSVTFDRETGYFLNADCFGSEKISGNLMSEDEALAAARGWYEKLPYPQGYEYMYVNKFDDETWMYSFCRKVDVEMNGEILHLTNAYEEARIGINPKTGDFVLCNAFYVPLLDDHKEGDVPLTEKQAREIAEKTLMGETKKDPDQAEIRTELVIAHPNYMFTSYESTDDFRMPSVTRLAWRITFDFPNDEGFADQTCINVDLYTGEILGGDVTI